MTSNIVANAHLSADIQLGLEIDTIPCAHNIRYIDYILQVAELGCQLEE